MRFYRGRPEAAGVWSTPTPRSRHIDVEDTTLDYAPLGASGEANGLPIVFREDGYINMTKAAKHFGKDIREFLKNASTKEYSKVLGEMMGIPHITQAKRGYHKNPDVGTYGHPKLAVFFARWLDVRFAVWCDLMIDNILRGNLQVSVAVPTEEALALKATTASLEATA